MQSDCTILCHHKQFMSDALSPHPCPHLVLSLFRCFCVGYDFSHSDRCVVVYCCDFFLIIFFNSYIIYLFIYLFNFFSCVRSLFRARAFSSCGKRGPPFIVAQGPLFIAVRGPLTIAAPPVAGHRLQTRRLSSCGSRAQSLRGMWDPPRPGLEPVFPALAGRLSTTAPPGKPYCCDFNLPFFDG